MALVTVTDSGGVSHLLHTSAFDSHRPPRLLGDWKAVWERHDAMTPSYFNAITGTYHHGRGAVIDELTRIVIKRHSYGPKRLRWLGEANLTHDHDRARIADRRFVRAEVIRLWRNFVRTGNA